MNRYQPLDDLELIHLINREDQSAFNELFNRYWKVLFDMAHKKVSSVDIAQEIVQEFFVDIWIRRGKLVIYDVKNYLFVAIKYKIIHHIKEELKQENVADINVQLLLKHNHIEEYMSYHELYEMVGIILNQLPEKTKEIFQLNRFEGKNAKEISQILVIPERTVEYHITQAIRVLKSKLKDLSITSIPPTLLWLIQ